MEEERSCLPYEKAGDAFWPGMIIGKNITDIGRTLEVKDEAPLYLAILVFFRVALEERTNNTITPVLMWYSIFKSNQDFMSHGLLVAKKERAKFR